MPLTYFKGEVLSTCRLDTLSVQVTNEVNFQLIATRGGPISHFKAGVLLLQLANHRLNVVFTDLRTRSLDINLTKVGKVDRGINLKGRCEFKINAWVHFHHIQLRRPCGIHLLLLHSLHEAALHELTGNFCSHSRAIATANLFQRHLTGSKSWNIYSTTRLLQTLGDLRFELLTGDGDRQTAF